MVQNVLILKNDGTPPQPAYIIPADNKGTVPATTVAPAKTIKDHLYIVYLAVGIGAFTLGIIMSYKRLTAKK